MRMLAVALVFIFFPVCWPGEIGFGPNTRFRFATIDQGRQILTNRDDFVERLSPFDRSARLKSGSDVSEAQFLAFIATNILAFDEPEILLVKGGLERLKPKIEPFKLKWPETILFIKTTGKDEGNAAYTRANAIVIPREKLGRGEKDSLDELICHELFHVLSRHNPAVREKLYETIGFQKCDELPFPPGLVRITNPDAPKNDHWIGVKVNGKKVSAIPILFAEPRRYDTRKGGEFFGYLQFKLLVVQTNGATGIKYDTANPSLVDINQAEGFFEQVGRNTEYLIHPEEVLAENFKFLVTDRKDIKTPEILTKMRSILVDGE